MPRSREKLHDVLLASSCRRLLVHSSSIACTFALLAACAASEEEPAPTPAGPDAGDGGADATSETGDPNVPADTPTAQDEACTENATTYCTQLERCFPFGLQLSYGDVATCVARVKPGCMQVWSAPGNGWTARRLRACVAARTALACDRFLLRKPEIDECAIVGTLPDGTACRQSAQCASGYCRIPSGLDCGVCVPKVPLGGACTSYVDCARDLMCSANGACRVPAGEAAECTNNVPCRLGLACIAGKCTKPQGPGQPCTPALGNIDCDYYQGAFCRADTSVCTQYTVANDGQACGASAAAPGTVCRAGGGCVAGPSGAACAAPGDDGTLCNPATGIVCKSPLSCVAGICRLFQPTECR